MAGGCQPVVYRGADSAALDRRLSHAGVAGNQQQNPISGTHGALQRKIDRAPRSVEAVAVKVEHPVRLDQAALEPSDPAAVESRTRNRLGRRDGGRTALR
jgi:hypothetical protein